MISFIDLYLSQKKISFIDLYYSIACPFLWLDNDIAVNMQTAVKEERREARRVKKETKEMYKSETQRAQRVAAISGPSSIHLS